MAYLELGNLEAQRDWGYAPEYVQAMWLMLQQKAPDDYVVGTGETYSIKYFVEKAFDIVGLNYQKYVKINYVENQITGEYLDFSFDRNSEVLLIKSS